MRGYKQVIISTLALIVGAGLVYAANVHFKREATFTDLGTTLQVCGALAGLGNQDVTITVTTTGSGSTTCANPAGFEAPGQNKVAVSESVTQTIRANEIKNGNVSFCQTTPGPGAVSAREAGCPNDNWTATITDVEFETATITVVQGGRVVLQETYDLTGE